MSGLSFLSVKDGQIQSHKLNYIRFKNQLIRLAQKMNVVLSEMVGKQ
jgi:hypothetical protein